MWGALVTGALGADGFEIEAELAALGLRPVLLTGDNPRAAARIAENAGVVAEQVALCMLFGVAESSV